MKIYTDGSCVKNPGPGTWAVVFVPGDGTTTNISGKSAADTTNNRMEMTAVLEGIKAAKRKFPGEKLEVHCDSAYVVNCFKNGWYKKWRQNGWIGSSGKPVENKDLWESLLLVTDNVEFVKVKGHADDEYNNLCDELARQAYDTPPVNQGASL